MTQPMPLCAHPESRRTVLDNGRWRWHLCEACGTLIDPNADLCRVPYILPDHPDRIALCGRGKGHPDDVHQETP